MDWQPIETAQKDGRTVLIAWPDGTVIAARFEVGKWWDDVLEPAYAHEGMTHWMPLPEFPTPDSSASS